MKNFIKEVNRIKPQYVRFAGNRVIAWGEKTLISMSYAHGGENIVYRYDEVKKYINAGGKDITKLKECDTDEIWEFDFNVSKGELYLYDIEITDDLYSAIDSNNPKYELNGMLVDFNAGYIVSSDTRRLCIRDIASSKIDSVIIEKEALKKEMIIKDLFVNNKYSQFNYECYTVTTENIPGRWLEYHRIIPQTFKYEIKFNGLEVKKGIGKFKDSIITFKSGVMTFKDNDAGVTFNSSCNYKCDTEIKIMMNAKYLKDAIIGNEVSIRLNENDLPAMLGNTVIMPTIDYIIGHIDHNAIDRVKYADDTWTYTAAPVKRKRVNKDAEIKRLQDIIIAIGGVF